MVRFVEFKTISEIPICLYLNLTTTYSKDKKYYCVYFTVQMLKTDSFQSQRLKSRENKEKSPDNFICSLHLLFS